MDNVVERGSACVIARDTIHSFAFLVRYSLLYLCLSFGRVFHRGGANTSKNIRVLLSASFEEDRLLPEGSPKRIEGFTYNILPEILSAEHRLEDLASH